ncbi:MAG: hypothetical protein M1832_003684 [Thelocarpon impressellum]|nr:MAG: hypothetical protein M1832_003684 [Thelocarpon impressellum]
MAAQLLEKKGVRIAVEGCGHGTLNAIYSSVEKSCSNNGWDGVDLLIIGGDFQAVRNASDLNGMSVPIKYREIGDFHEYYSGSRRAPYLTLFIGGNHEASNYLQELYYGGWVAPDIFYLGAANVLRLGPLRIAGISGIWKGYNYNKPHHERLPYNQDDVKSIYHVRELDVRKLLQIRTQVDIGLSHDWPRAVERSGNQKWLFSRKDMFEAESRDGTLGSAAARYLLDRLRPAYWFSAHLHIKFPAVVHHAVEAKESTPGAEKLKNTEEIDLNGDVDGEAAARNADEITLDVDMDIDSTEEATLATTKSSAEKTTAVLEGDVGGPTSCGPKPGSTSQKLAVPDSLREQLPASFARPAPSPSAPEMAFPRDITNRKTQFLALDKCLPGRKFLQILDIEPISIQPDSSPARSSSGKLRLEYDKEWLAITRAFAGELQYGDRRARTPVNAGEAAYQPRIKEEEDWVEDHVASRDKLLVPENFSITAPVYDPALVIQDPPPPIEYNNPQTIAFCELLGIENKFFATEEEKAQRMRQVEKAEEGAAMAAAAEEVRGAAGDAEGSGEDEPYLDPTKRHVVGVAIIVTQPDQPNLGRYGLLILKRANEEQDFPNAWELPGGHIEKHDQTVFHAVVRETQEETGQEIDAVLGQLDDMLWESSSGASNVQLNYVVSVKAGKPVVLNPEEHSEWV